MRTNALTWGLPLAKDPASTVKNTVRYGMVPAGPAGDFPGSNCHGFGIPAGSRNKGAAWEFIKWALSKEMLSRLVKDHGYPSVCRRSVIESEAFKQALTLNGQDVASLYLKVLELGGESGYMKYRTVPVFPQVGDKINRAIEAIATKQMDAPTRIEAGPGAGDRGDQDGRLQDRPMSLAAAAEPFVAADPHRQPAPATPAVPDAVPGAVAGGADGGDAGADGLSARHQLHPAEPDQPGHRLEFSPADGELLRCCSATRGFTIRCGCRRSCRSGRWVCNC